MYDQTVARPLSFQLKTVTILTLPWLGLANGYASQIKVTLFGQNCSMTGPYSEIQLSEIHEISPERLPPDAKVEQMKKVRSKAAGLTGLSPALENYRDHLKRRLSAHIGFAEAMEETKKNPSLPIASVLKNIKEHIPAARFGAFEKDVTALFTRTGAKWSEVFSNLFREKYESFIQPDTEEEFHKAIRISKVQYDCALDEGSDENGSDPGEE